MSDLEKSRDLNVEGHAMVEKGPMIVPLSCQNQKKLRNKNNYNALAHILPEIGKVT